MTRSKFFCSVTLFAAFWAATAPTGSSQTLAAATGLNASSSLRNDQLSKIRHIVVIYQENHSFDNLYGGWEGVNGRANADAAHTIQIKQASLTMSALSNYF